ncbi:MAG: 3-oxoacyl-[acyl-carrier-protein] reductase [Syntrophomonadaceae bacterium]|nr:3-oxoacyl-[acyl-carrier-protein] reductase [Syntrophomonadaceae bacterium]NLX01405.1 3-oxoacyl-[acyl-carrier-protein] reductase [Syntrophomonadaceae bacterium]
MHLHERVAIITGSSRGIGRATALVFARTGYRVVVNYNHNREQAEQVLQEIEALGSNGILLGADVSKAQEARDLIEKSVKEFGRVDVLVNNAGINHDQLMLRIQDEEWERVINTNLSSAFYCSRAAVKHMFKKRFGRIINISSVVGISGNAGQTHYSAAKSGLLGLTLSIAQEYGNRGITANAVAPGFIESDMTASLSPEQRQQILSGIAVGRLGKPEDVAALVLFLASDEAAYINGQVIRVDGGMRGI